MKACLISFSVYSVPFFFLPSFLCCEQEDGETRLHLHELTGRDGPVLNFVL